MKCVGAPIHFHAVAKTEFRFCVKKKRKRIALFLLRRLRQKQQGEALEVPFGFAHSKHSCVIDVEDEDAQPEIEIVRRLRAIPFIEVDQLSEKLLKELRKKGEERRKLKLELKQEEETGTGRPSGTQEGRDEGKEVGGQGQDREEGHEDTEMEGADRPQRGDDAARAQGDTDVIDGLPMGRPGGEKEVAVKKEDSETGEPKAKRPRLSSDREGETGEESGLPYAGCGRVRSFVAPEVDVGGRDGWCGKLASGGGKGGDERMENRAQAPVEVLQSKQEKVSWGIERGPSARQVKVKAGIQRDTERAKEEGGGHCEKSQDCEQKKTQVNDGPGVGQMSLCQAEVHHADTSSTPARTWEGRSQHIDGRPHAIAERVPFSVENSAYHSGLSWYDTEEEKYQKVEGMYKSLTDKKKLRCAASVLCKKADMLQKQGEYKQALLKCELALFSHEKLIAEPRSCQSATGLSKKAAETWTFCKTFGVTQSDVAEIHRKLYVAPILHQMAAILREDGKHGEAMKRVREELQIYRRSKAPPVFEKEVRCLAEMAVLLFHQNEFSEAMERCYEALWVMRGVWFPEDPFQPKFQPSRSEKEEYSEGATDIAETI
uniref:Uncharacterized protein n=1 Tax=Chromera velia CCMP2878 TaxID=1169474 RepID=A0A0G4IAT3_9ALVE|eukprot:Cvel_12681.t1-p1 / transcript=Cvel_12681.t1 / gene=Cvel_12681 / organism=Chromera_velia_CCMP2878 / gene_product=hypothetical protein / transcript_product=hypothetical protein / location=Cvel_scaffold838:57263-59736(-) / protein_length=600 / sequence_SO=supercontig / SO=protein_coding / is_pseudo=false